MNKASFKAAKGELLVVMGMSGSGKSTLLRYISRLTEPTAGKIFIDGEDLTAMTSKPLVDLRRNKMGMFFQSFALLPHKTVLENIVFPLQIKGQSTAAFKSRKVDVVLRPLLNIAQTMPHFSYLVPVMVMFGVGDDAGSIATIIFATPPMVHLMMLGLKKVPVKAMRPTVTFPVFLRNFDVASRSSFLETYASRISPSWSTARQRQCVTPLILTKTSSKCQRQ